MEVKRNSIATLQVSVSRENSDFAGRIVEIDTQN
jgi:hypothetical protein